MTISYDLPNSWRSKGLGRRGNLLKLKTRGGNSNLGLLLTSDLMFAPQYYIFLSIAVY